MDNRECSPPGEHWLLRLVGAPEGDGVGDVALVFCSDGVA